MHDNQSNFKDVVAGHEHPAQPLIFLKGEQLQVRCAGSVQSPLQNSLPMPAKVSMVTSCRAAVLTEVFAGASAGKHHIY